MRLLAIALVVTLGVACKRDVTEDVQGLEKRACECASKKDAACGRAVLADLAKLKDVKNVKADEPKAAAAAKNLATCMIQSGVTPLEIHESINKQEPQPAAESN